MNYITTTKVAEKIKYSWKRTSWQSARHLRTNFSVSTILLHLICCCRNHGRAHRERLVLLARVARRGETAYTFVVDDSGAGGRDAGTTFSILRNFILLQLGNQVIKMLVISSCDRRLAASLLNHIFPSNFTQLYNRQVCVKK